MPQFLVADGDRIVGGLKAPSPEEAVIQSDSSHLVSDDEHNIRVYELATDEYGNPDPYLEEDLQL